MMILVVLVIPAVVFATGTSATSTRTDPFARIVAPADQETTPPKTEGDAAPAGAIEPLQADTGRWNIEFAPYAWLPTLDIKGAGKITPDDILDNLDFFAMGVLQAEKDGSPWGFYIDTIYMDLEKKPVELQATIVSGYASYRLSESGPTALLVGARYIDLDLELGSLGGNEDWADPLVGLRSGVTFTDKWSANAFVDVGGFGIGAASKITYNMLGALNYKLNDAVSFATGYRYLYVDQAQKVDFEADIYGFFAGIRFTL